MLTYLFGSASENHLNHMSNSSWGYSPVDASVKAKAYMGQKAPIRNLLNSALSGVVNGANYYALAILLSPLFNESQRDSFTKEERPDNVFSKADICGPCIPNTKRIVEQIVWIQKQAIKFDAEFNKLSSTERNLAQGGLSAMGWAGSNLVGLEMGANCAFGTKSRDEMDPISQCKFNNYAGSALYNHDHFSQYFVAGCSALAIYYFASSIFNRESIENSIIDDLSKKYHAAAKALQEKAEAAYGDVESLQEVKELAANILKNEMDSIDELESLHLPKLASMEAKKGLLLPVMNAATGIAHLK